MNNSEEPNTTIGRKPLKQKAIPMWLAPIVGPIVGVVVGYAAFNKQSRRSGQQLDIDPTMLIGGLAAAGFVAGLAVMILDLWKAKKNPS